ncbi:MAG: hypothetical protein QW156_03815 [Candidatus Aenigmatarchaeota archaeon]
MKVIECDVENSVLFEHHSDSYHSYGYGYAYDPDVKMNIPHASLLFSIGRCKANLVSNFNHRVASYYDDGSSLAKTYYINEFNIFKITNSTSELGTYYWAGMALIGGWHNEYHSYNYVTPGTSYPNYTYYQCHNFDLVIPLEPQVLNTEVRSEASGWTIPSRTYNNNYIFDVNHTNILYTLGNYTTNSASINGITSPNTSPSPFYAIRYDSSNNLDSNITKVYNALSYGTQGQTVTSSPTTYPSQAYILLFAKFASFNNQPTQSVQLKKDVRPVMYNLFNVVKEKATSAYASWVDTIYNEIIKDPSYVSQAQAHDGSNTIYLSNDTILTKANYNFYSTFENFIVGVESV